MSAQRARANHSLYLARILLEHWSRARELEHLPAATLAQAYEPAVCDHLVDAYGWFLLEITRPEPAPERPPRGCAELPPPVPGRALPGEIHEFRRLEATGWLGELLGRRRGRPVVASDRDNLAAPANPGPQDLAQWADRLEALFQRMGDSLDEY